MRVAYLINRYPQTSQSFIVREVAELRQRGVEVQTVSIWPVPDADLLSEEARQAAAGTAVLVPTPGQAVRVGLRVLARHPLAGLSLVAGAISRPAAVGRLRQLAYALQALCLWSLLADEGIGHVHVHFANNGADAARLAVVLGRASGRGPQSWSFTMHGPTELSDLRHFDVAAKVADAAFVVCISDFARSQLQAVSDPDMWSRLIVVHCGVRVDDWASIERSPFDGALRVLYLGRLVPEKGQRVLLEAVATCRAAGLDVRLVCAGGGAEQARLERAVVDLGLQGAVELPGPVGYDEVPALYRAADAFCLPSFAEGLPIVLMEAMAAGLPVVTTQIAGVPELVRDGANGLLVPPGRADLLAEALARLAGDPALRRTLGERGREAIRSGFDIATTAERLEHAFEEYIPGGGGSGRRHGSDAVGPPRP